MGTSHAHIQGICLSEKLYLPLEMLIGVQLVSGFACILWSSSYSSFSLKRMCSLPNWPPTIHILFFYRSPLVPANSWTWLSSQPSWVVTFFLSLLWCPHSTEAPLVFPRPNLAQLFISSLTGHSVLHICVCLCVICLAGRVEALSSKHMVVFS